MSPELATVAECVRPPLVLPTTRADLALLVELTSSSSLLAVILDLSPLSWADAASGADGEEPLTLQTTLDHLLIFLNANLAQATGNGLAVWGVKGSKRSGLFAAFSRHVYDRLIHPSSCV